MNAGPGVDMPGKDEQKVGKAIQICNRFFGDRLGMGEADDSTLCTPANRSGEVDPGSNWSPTGKDKVVERWKIDTQGIDEFLQMCRILPMDTGNRGGSAWIRRGELGSQREEFRLDRSENHFDIAFVIVCEDDTEDRIQLIHRAICLDSKGIFWHALTAVECSVSPVACLGIDFHECAPM